jgi:hypothetical protein
MKGRPVVLAALALTASLSSVAAAGPAGPKQRVAIDMKIFPSKTFVLTPLQAGVVKGDSGRITTVEQVLSMSGRAVMRDGQRVRIYYPTIWTLEGKRGTLSIRERTEWVEVGSNVNGDAYSDSVAFGTWSVVRGTGQYAQLAGSGRSGHMGLGRPWLARQEGFVTSP